MSSTDPGTTFAVTAVAHVESTLGDRTSAPRQPDEGAPPATVVFVPEVADAVQGLGVGDRIVLLTWLDRAARDVLETRPRGDTTRPVTGVFATRSPDRPNPIGLHTVVVRSLDGLRLGVDALEALDGTPVLDVKPALEAVPGR